MQSGLRGSAAQRPSSSSSRRVAIIRAQSLAGTVAIPSDLTSSSNGNGNGNGNGMSHAMPMERILQPVNVNFPEPTPAVLSAAANYQALANVGAKKTQLSTANLIVSGMLAGAYIAYGAFLMCAVQGGMTGILATTPGLVKLIGGLIFPVGLTLVVMSGTELYTGNTASIPMAIYEGKATIPGLLHNWVWSYLGNFIGSLLMVAAVSATGVLNNNPIPVGIAEMKAGLPWATAFIRSILCNWLVCMAVWNANAAQSLPGKMMGLWGPIAAFVSIGLEHSVANMFLIPMGMVLGAKVTFMDFLFNNLLPVTLGNTVAGVLFVGTAFAFVHGSLGKAAAR